MKFFDPFLGEILPTRNIDCLEPTSFAPPPGRDGCNANISQPLVEANDRRTVWRRSKHPTILQIWESLGVDNPPASRVLFLRFRRTAPFTRSIADTST